METVRLIYASVAAPQLTNEDLLTIGEISVRNNKMHGLTGFLCFSDHAFLQVLEGTGPVLNRLYRTLLADPRHSEVQLLSFVPIGARGFAAWSMHAENWDVTTPAPRRSFVLRQFGQDSFRPAEMSAKRALAFLEALAETERRGEKPVRDGQRVV